MGGILYIFTGFQLANFFPGGRSTVCALLIGSYNSSALVYPILYEFYTGGASFITCMTIHGVIAVITFIEAWINTPSEPIPEPVEDENNNENNNEKSNEKEGFDKQILLHIITKTFRNSEVYVEPSVVLYPMYFISRHHVYHCASIIGKLTLYF